MASGDRSTAFGDRVSADGLGSVAMGGGTDAIGKYSVALGGGANAVGDYSVALSLAQADGKYSFAVGPLGTIATSYSSVAIGQYNEGINSTGGSTTWKGDDLNAVLEVGIGTSSAPANRRNAFTILQDGGVEVGKATQDAGHENDVPLTIKSDGSVILAKAQGDISMGIYE